MIFIGPENDFRQLQPVYEQMLQSVRFNSLMAQYEAVLFDFDGVLVDSEPVHFGCWQEILGPFGIDLDWKTYSEHCIGITDRAMLDFSCSRQNPPADIEPSRRVSSQEGNVP